MSDADPLLALLELMLRTFTQQHQQTFVPKVKPGGHPEEIFLDLTEEEKESIECSICYMILKDVHQCKNEHKFCQSCIVVWENSGHSSNHSRCPVCRAVGLYVKNSELDEKINNKKVKCSMNSCSWSGPLKLLPNHQHTTYTDPARLKQAGVIANDKELPAVRNAPTQRPSSLIRSRHLTSGSESSTSSDNATAQAQRQPLRTLSNGNSSSSSSGGGGSNTRSNGTESNASTANRSTTNRSTTRSRTRSRPRQNSSSPQRRSNTTATGLNGRLTSRPRINNTGTVEGRSTNTNGTSAASHPRVASNRAAPATASAPSPGDENGNSTEHTTVEEIHIPHPPRTPRPAAQTPRRLPTLPNPISLDNSNRGAGNDSHPVTDTNNNVSEADAEVSISAGTPGRIYMEATIRRPFQPRSFGMIRERLNESRQRLDMLMSVFSTELDRGRQDLTSFQEERERRRQEQLAEVRELGNRLSQVASELRGLLSQRRQIRAQMDNLLSSDD